MSEKISSERRKRNLSEERSGEPELGVGEAKLARAEAVVDHDADHVDDDHAKETKAEYQLKGGGQVIRMRGGQDEKDAASWEVAATRIGGGGRDEVGPRVTLLTKR